MTVLGELRNEPVGRLFNRAPISNGNEFADHDYDTRPWFMVQEASPAFVGGFLSSWQEDLNKSTQTVVGLSRGNRKLRERRQCDGKVKKSFLDDHRERVESEAEDETSNEDWGWGLEEEEEGFADDEKSPLPYPRVEDTPSPVQHQQKTNVVLVPRTETKTARTAKSSMSTGKKRRHTVAFAGSLILMEKSNQTDFVLQSDFVDIVDIVNIPHFSQYRKEIYEALWYTRDENEQMKQDYFYWKRISRSGGRNPYAKTSPPPMPPQRLSHEGKSHNLRFLRHQRTLATVFREQERQRKMCYQIYGRIVDSFGDHHISYVLDPERLKEVYRKVGKTRRRQEQAIERAKQYHDFHEMATNTTLTTTHTNVMNNLRYEQQQAEGTPHVDQDIREWSSMEASCSRSCLDVSTPTSYFIHCVCFALLSPFLEHRGQPLFLDIGDDMIVSG